MKKNIFIIFLLLIVTKVLFSQSTDCGTAVAQLQNYATQVNQIYLYEYWNGIPNVRCPAYDQWGRPFNPVLVQNCRYQMLGYLNNWYGQQCNYVNNMYVQIINGCSANPNASGTGPAPGQVEGGNQNSEIDTEEIGNLAVGIDEDKAVKITIPKTAAGFKPR